jgi:hypothetical protein
MVFGAGMGFFPHPIDLDPVIPVVAGILKEAEFGQFLRFAVCCLDSSSFLNVSLVTLRNLPYVLWSDSPLVQEFSNAISCRLHYMESGLMSIMSCVHNVAFAVAFSAASLVTLGQVKEVAEQTSKHWIHTALAIVAMVISAAGVLSPQLGARANGAVILGMGAVAVQWMQLDQISKLGDAYQRHRQELRAAFLAGLRGDGALFNREWVPLLNFLDAQLNSDLRTFEDLVNVAGGVGRLAPAAIPTVSTAVALRGLEELVAGGGHAGSSVGVTA